MSVLPGRALLPGGGFSADDETLDHSGLPGDTRGAGGASGRVAGPGAELAAAARGIRVAMLGAAVVAMSLVDLYITLLYLDAVGLAEENPLARAVMSQSSPGLLAGWKILTLLPAVLVFLRYRRRVSAELLAWVACALLAMVTVRWGQYADQTDLLMISLPALDDGIDHRWVPARD